jgi:hypothetical protein
MAAGREEMDGGFMQMSGGLKRVVADSRQPY